MIFTNNGFINVLGSKLDVMTDLTMIMSTLLNADKDFKLSKEDVDLCVETATKSDDEITAEISRLLDKLGKVDY